MRRAEQPDEPWAAYLGAPRSGALARRIAALLAALLAAQAAVAQGIDTAQRQRLERASGTDWVLGATLQRALVPGAPDTTLGIVTADRGRLHLEARWNYEAIGAGTLFAGSNWRGAWGGVTATIVPMLGVAFGSLRGVVPALEVGLEWGAFDAYLEAEYLRDLDDRSRSFAYAWSELGWSPGDGWRLGAVGQRSRRYASLREVQRGVFVQRDVGGATLGVFVFEPADPSSRLVLLMLGAGF